MTAATRWPDAGTVERNLTSASINATPYVTLLATGYILQYHLHEYAAWPVEFAWVAAVGAELTGLSIMATKTDRLRKGLSVERMDKAFRFYVVIIATVNGILGASSLLGLLAWGVLAADLAMGLIAIPLFWMIADRHEIQAIEADAENAKAQAAADKAQAFADEQTALNNQLERDLKMKAAESAEAEKLRAEKRAEAAEKKSRKTSVETSAPKFTEVLPKRVSDYPNKTEAAAEMIPAFILAHGREPKLAEVSAMLEVGPSQASGYMKPYRSAK